MKTPTPHTPDQGLIVVDYEHCFANPELAELYVKGGETLAPYIRQVIAEVKAQGGKIIATRDWHDRGKLMNFAGNYLGKAPITQAGPTPQAFITAEEIKNWNPWKNGIRRRATFSVDQLKQAVAKEGTLTLWPDHGIQNTLGGEFFELDQKEFDAEILKGEGNVESYSGFGGREKETNETLAEVLKRFAVGGLKVVGLATDYCVKATALDARKLGYPVQLLLKGVAAVDPATEIEALRELREAGVQIVD